MLTCPLRCQRRDDRAPQVTNLSPNEAAAMHHRARSALLSGPLFAWHRFRHTLGAPRSAVLGPAASGFPRLCALRGPPRLACIAVHDNIDSFAPQRGGMASTRTKTPSPYLYFSWRSCLAHKCANAGSRVFSASRLAFSSTRVSDLLFALRRSPARRFFFSCGRNATSSPITP